MTAEAVVTLLPQNGQHLETVQLLLPALVDRGLHPRVLLMEGLFHQGLTRGQLPMDVPVVELALAAPTPFYRLGPLQQVGLLRQATAPIKSAIGQPRTVLAFNDGALQRLAFRYAPGARTALLIDGMISDYPEVPGARSAIRRWLKRAGRRTRGSWLGVVLPSDVGLSPVDAVFVVGDHSADVLRRHGSRASRILATGLPRWPTASPRPPSARLERILYLSAAFAWHDRHGSARAQLDDAILLQAQASALGIEVRVRVHPRDDLEAWHRTGLAVIDPRTESMATSIGGVDLVLGMVSTGLLEAISIGTVAHPMIIMDNPANYASAFVADPGLEMIASGAELESRLRAYRAGISPAVRARQSMAIGGYVAAGGAQAVDRIADELARLAR